MTDAAYEKGVPFRLEDLVTVQEGAVVSRTLIDRPTGSATLFSFDAGQALSEHTAPYDALVQVLSGRVEIRLGGVPHPLGPGDALVMPAGVPHALKALEPFKMFLVMIRS